MALSDYLTDEEWDACLYVHVYGEAEGENFGNSMHLVIDELLKVGYSFSGLDEKGRKLSQVSTQNGNKIVKVFFKEENGIDIPTLLDNGRSFLKEKCPSLVTQNDEIWKEELKSMKATQ